jgi:hypothetical protein
MNLNECRNRPQGETDEHPSNFKIKESLQCR